MEQPNQIRTKHTKICALEINSSRIYRNVYIAWLTAIFPILSKESTASPPCIASTWIDSRRVPACRIHRQKSIRNTDRKERCTQMFLRICLALGARCCSVDIHLSHRTSDGLQQARIVERTLVPHRSEMESV